MRYSSFRFGAIFLFISIFLFILPSSSSSAAAATYYVATTGNDTNPGTLFSPFATIQAGVNVLQPGDTLNIRDGSYNEQIKINNKGSSSNSTYIKNYPGETPIIDGAGISITPSAGLIDIRGSSNIEISGLTIINSDDAAVYSFNSRYINLHDNVTKESNSSGIGIWKSDHIKVDHNRVVNARNAPTVPFGGHEECISISSTNNFEVSYNEVYYEGITGYLGGAGIDVKESSYDGTVHHNYTHDIIYDGGIYLDAWTAGLNNTPTLHNVKVYNNKVFQAGGISIGSERGGTVENIDVYNNIVIRSSYSGIIMSNTGDSVGGNGPRKNINIFNNTIYQSTGNGGAGIYIVTKNIENIVIRNNIVAFDPKWVGQITLADPSVQSQITADHNITFGRKLCSNDYPDCYNYSDINLDPQFIDPANYYLFLKTLSPAIDSGVDLSSFGVTNDYDNNSRPQGPAYDIGAYEYTISQSPTSLPTNSMSPSFSPTTISLQGDINNDRVVNILDYTLLSNSFGTNNTASDINHDSTVNILDYTLLSNNFGKSS